MSVSDRLRILTWHVHGNYLYYLTHTPHDFCLPTGKNLPGYAGRAPGFPWPPNMHEIDADAVRDLSLDCILYQSEMNYRVDQCEILSVSQRMLPRIFLEHDPPQEHPTNARHSVAGQEDLLLVHVTQFNALMWDSGQTPTKVIEHGVVVPPTVHYTGELPRGLVVVNALRRRGRRLGWDVYERVRAEVPLDLIGMESEAAGGLGEIAHEELPAFMCRYRFLFNPIRYTSLGLAVCEAMSLGVPVIGLATTEMAMTIENGVSGYVSTDIDALIARMHELIRDPAKARQLGEGAKRAAQRRFGIGRFGRDWDATFHEVTSRAQTMASAPRRLGEMASIRG